MDLDLIFELQLEFDKSHFPDLVAEPKSEEERIRVLTHLVLGAFGELGELANIVKKVELGDFSLQEARTWLYEETADVFIYLIKICQQMDIDLLEAFLAKLDRNRRKFHRKK